MYARPSNVDVRQLIREARARGWTVTGGGQRHYKLLCPNPCKCLHVLASSTTNRLATTRARTRLINHSCWESQQCQPHRPPVLPVPPPHPPVP
jgi:hypothetical protein